MRLEAALAARGLQLHDPAPAFEQLHVRHASPPVQSRGAPPLQVPVESHASPTVQKPSSHAPDVEVAYWQPPALHVGLERHCGWAATQSVQAPPPAPHAVACAPARHTPAAQQPLHGPEAHAPPATQRPVEVLQAAPDGQSAALVHPQPPGTHAVPCGFAAQLAQAAPPLPHWPADWEAASMQLAPLQHPAGQEVALHTQLPPTHAWAAAHDRQAAPPAPHALALLPAWHTPFESQQPVGHVVALQVPQVCVPGLHVVAAGQSPPPLQPQRPETHACPAIAAVQSVHAPPVVPHAPAAVPARHVPPPQQPPMQVPWPAPPHAAVHAPPAQVGCRPVHAAQAAPAVPHMPLA